MPPSLNGGSSKLTITGVLRSDLAGPIFCTAKNSVEQGKSPPFNLTVYCKYFTCTVLPSDSSWTGANMFWLNEKEWLSKRKNELLQRPIRLPLRGTSAASAENIWPLLT